MGRQKAGPIARNFYFTKAMSVSKPDAPYGTAVQEKMKSMFICCGLMASVACFLTISCAGSWPLVKHGVVTPPAVEQGNVSVFNSGLSGRKSDALLVTFDGEMSKSRRLLILKSRGRQRSHVFPDDFTECSSWLVDDESNTKCYLLRMDGDGFSASQDHPLEVRKIGFEGDVGLNLWKLPAWYPKR